MKILGVNYKRASSFLRGISSRLRKRWPLLLLFFLAAAVYSTNSILRHWHFGSGLDVTIFDQGVWRYSRFHAPIITATVNSPVNHLGDHFHPIIALLSPLYWIVNSAEALLVGQALIIALSIIPVFLFAERRLGKRAAWLFAISYSIFWAVQQTVDFEFHEIAFAIPLIAFAVYFIDLGKTKSYFACFILLLLTKESLPALVAFFGIYLLLLKRYRDGLICLVMGTTSFQLITKVVIPFFAGHRHTYWTYDALGPDLFGAMKTMVKRPGLVFGLLISPAVKLRTIWLIFSPFLALPFFSPLIVLFIPIFAERFLSARPAFWEPVFHYNATVAPLVALAAADGLGRLTKLVKRERARAICILLPSAAILVINLWLLPGQPLWRLVSSEWRLTETDRDGYAALSIIPPNVTVAAQVNLAAHLAHRPGIYLLSPDTPPPEAAYIIASSHVPFGPFRSYQEIEDYLSRQQEKGYLKVFDRNGWVVLRRPDIVPGASPVLLTEEGSTRAAAIDSVTFRRGPFTVSTKYFINQGGLTRITLFAMNLNADFGIEIPDIEVLAEDARGVVHQLEVEAVASAQGHAGLTQLNVKLPAALKDGGDIWVSIRANGMTSNKALINLLPDEH